MSKMLSLLNRLDRQFIVLASLIFSAVLCMAILTLRVRFAHNYRHSYLAWNLFLAWLPLMSAFIAYKFYQKPTNFFRVLTVIFMAFWLLFLPNAPYLITDLVHLAPRNDISFWFDLTMFVAFAVTGLLYGLVSLYWMQRIVSEMAGVVAGWIFVLAVSALSSFGIYLGRFENWNSWDILQHPIGLLTNIGEIFRHPIAHYEVFAFSGLFTLFLVATYFMLSALTQLPRESNRS